MQNLKWSRIGAAAILALGMLVAPRLAHAVGEQNGRIQGFITEAQTNAPVPGADITIQGPNLPGGPIKTQSLDDGSYEVVELPPGRYDVDVSYAGVKPIKRRVIVRQGEALPLNISWSPELAQTEVTVVVEERHMTKPDSTQTGTVLTADTQSKLATGRSYQSIALQVAAVNDVNGDGNPQIKGGQYTHNRWLVDGLDITDPVTNTFSSNINFDSIGSVDIITGGMEAQYNSLGGIINLVTLAGSDEWHVDTSFYVNNAKFSAGVQSGPEMYNDQRPFGSIQKPNQQSYNANLNIGGPLIKHKLWFNFSFEYGYRESAIQAGPPLFIKMVPQVSHRFLLRLKLTWAPNEKHRITLSASADPAYFSNVNQDPGYSPLAQDFQGQGGIFAILQWDWFRTKNMNFNLQTGFQYSTIDTGPQGRQGGPFGGLTLGGFDKDPRFSGDPSLWTYNPNRPQQINQDDGSVWHNGGAITSNKRYTFQFDPSISLRGRAAGSHDAKIGLQFRYMRFDLDYETPGDRYYINSGGGPLQNGICDPTTGMGGCLVEVAWDKWGNYQQGVSLGGYIQDRWKPIKRLTITPGLRLDWGYSVNSQGQTVSNLFGVGPRLGINVDLTGDAKTIFSAYYGRANETSTLLAAAYADLTKALYVNFWDGTQFTPGYSVYGEGGYQIDRNIKPPHTDEVTLSLRREVFRNTSASLDYTYKRVSNIWEGVEVNQIWDPTGTRVTGYVNGEARQILLYTTPDANRREFHGLDFIVEGRPTQNWDFLASYSLAWTFGRGAEQMGQIGSVPSAFYNPRFYDFFNGFLPEDIRHSLKIRITYTWKGLNLGGFMNWTTGIPRTKRFFSDTDAGYSTLRSPIGTDPGADGNDPTKVAEFRTPSALVLNARVSYDFHHLIKQHIIVIFDMFNLLGLNAPTSVEQTDIANFGKVTGRQPPFRFQLGLRYIY